MAPSNQAFTGKLKVDGQQKIYVQTILALIGSLSGSSGTLAPTDYTVNIKTKLKTSAYKLYPDEDYSATKWSNCVYNQ